MLKQAKIFRILWPVFIVKIHFLAQMINFNIFLITVVLPLRDHRSTQVASG